MNAMRLWAGVAAVGLGLAAGTAAAQDRDRRGGNAPIETVGGILERSKPRQLTLMTDLTIRMDLPNEVVGDPDTGKPTVIPGGTQRPGGKELWDFQSAAVVFPVAPETASSKPQNGFTGELKGNDILMDDKPTLLKNYHSGTRLGKWVLRNWRGEEVSLDVTLPVEVYNTAVLEDKAQALEWPGSWPAEAASTFQPQAFIDVDPTVIGPDGKPMPYDMAPIKELVERATDGKDPKSVKPYTLAKFLAGEVVRNYSLTGDGLVKVRTGIGGLDVIGAPAAALERRVSPFDLVAILTAVYRQAGLPARMVVGWDTGKDDEDFLGQRTSGDLRAWVEFALMGKNEKGADQLVWIPVDIVQMRGKTPSLRALDRPWKYFGNHDELNRIIPFSLHYHPPTTVIAHGAPAFWGWMVTPEPPKANVLQTIRFTAISTAKRAEDMKKERERDRERR